MNTAPAGLARSNAQAARNYEFTASAGMPFALFRPGRLAELGVASGGRSWAIEPYAAAANVGVAQAAHNLGFLFLQDCGAPGDMAEAARWMTLAA